MDRLLSLDSLGLGGGTPPPPRPGAPLGTAASPGSLGLGAGPDAVVDAAPCPRPQLVHRGRDGTAVYRLADRGFKVILAPNPPPERLRAFLHERTISNLLPRPCRVRRVTDVATVDGRPALAFEWVRGVTLREWLTTGHRAGLPRRDPTPRLHAAVAVARTLADFHAGGVAHNGLTPDDVVLSTHGGGCVATFLDLSGCVVFRGGRGGADAAAGADASSERRAKEHDLRSLGWILSQIFGRDEDGAQEGQEYKDDYGQENVAEQKAPDRSSRTKRGKRGNPLEGLPLYLGSLVSALLCASAETDEVCYESAQDVLDDLRGFAENSDGCYTKMELDEWTVNSRLRLQPEKFYGRQVQISMILQLFESSMVLGNQPLMATIAGAGGTGKSTLVNEIKKPRNDPNVNGCFIEGKFNKHQRPDSVLVDALNAFFGDLIEADATESLVRMKWRINDAVGSGSNKILLEYVPNLQAFMDDGAEPAENLSASNRRLKFVLCKLIGAIACRDHPLVLILDDLQWADDTTLDIIRMTMMDPEIRHFLFLGCYRDNEVDSSHPLMACIQSIRGQGISVVPIKIGPIEKESVTKLLSEALCMPASLCRPLGSVVHSKTGGIILFVLRFLASLNDDGDLWFSMSARRWMYNLKEIKRKEIHGDVVSHMTEHMKSLSKKMQMGLKFISCLGPNFDAQVLAKGEQFCASEDTFIKRCVEFGFLQNVDSTKYVWAHDHIHQAAYDLIPLSKRDSFHLLVGTRLFMSTSPSEMQHMIFFIVDNMNRGANLIDDVDQKYEVSQLNLEAGEKALSASAFHSAAEYLLAGLSHLGLDSWERRYNLTIKLYDAASEALFVAGDFSKLFELIDVPLLNARSFEDKLNILNNLTRAFAASSRFEEGINQCMSILCQLGEAIPTNITADVYLEEVRHVKQLLHGKSQDDLLSLPMMRETQKLAAMQFMNHALTMTFVAKPLLNPIIVLRMVKMSVEHGICNISCFAFACYGAWLVNEPSCDIDGGHRMGCVATKMMKRLGAVEMAPRLHATVNGFIDIWKEPWQAIQPKHLEAYETGAKAGDMEYATTNLFQYANIALWGCGGKLGALSQNIQSYAKRAFQCNQRGNWMAHVVLHQLTLDLMGVEYNAFAPYSNKTSEDSCFATCRERNAIAICRFICCKKKYCSFLLGDLNAAASVHELSLEFPIGTTGRQLSQIISVFIDGMIGFFFARKHCANESKWTNLGLDAIRSLSSWAKSSEWNFSNKLHLLEAEFYFLKDDNRALDRYYASIRAAREHHFIHEEGLAEEKLATYFLQRGKHDDAMRHFTNAKICYKSWEAHALVQRVEKTTSILLPIFKDKVGCQQSLSHFLGHSVCGE